MYINSKICKYIVWGDTTSLEIFKSLFSDMDLSDRIDG